MSVYDDLADFPASGNDPRGFRRFEITGYAPIITIEWAAKVLGMTVDEIGLFNFGSSEWGFYGHDCFRMLWIDGNWQGEDLDGYKGSWFWAPGDCALTPEGQKFAKLSGPIYLAEDDTDSDDDSRDDDDDKDDDEASDDDEIADDDEAALEPVGDGDCVVEPGFCISSIAVLNGLHWKRLWDNPANADLKRIRKHPNMLLPGDKVTTEDEQKEIKRGSDRRYRCLRRGVPGLLRLRFTLFGAPRKGEAYEIEVGGANVGKGKLDADGSLSCVIAPYAENAVVFLGDKRQRLEFALGHLPPANTIAGLQARLANLNYYTGPVDGKLDDAGKLTAPTTRATGRFVRRNFPGQDLDDFDLGDIFSELVKRHGS